MLKTKQREYLEAMKRNPDNHFFVSLTNYLELRIELQKDCLVGQPDMDEIKRIQGRVLELQEFLKGLTRKPSAVPEHTGGFGQ